MTENARKLQRGDLLENISLMDIAKKSKRNETFRYAERERKSNPPFIRVILNF